MTRLGEHTVVLVTQVPTGAKDRYGKDVTQDAFTPIEGCSVTPRRSVETPDQSAAIVTGWELLAPPGFPIDAAAAVIWPATETTDPDAPWAGPRLEVDGEVGDWGEFIQTQLQRRT